MSGDILDDFADLSGWTPFASGQARLEISRGRGRRGWAMRLDFDFGGGGGFVVARKAFDLALPESYAFSFAIRGRGPANSLELKLVDRSSQNVWRYREEVFELTQDWRMVRIKSTQIPFAWGPLGGGPARDIAAIELAIAAGPGGRGRLWIDDLRIEDTSYYKTPEVRTTSALPGCEPHLIWDPSPATCWRSDASGGPQQLLIDFQQEREYGGLTIRWDPQRRPRALAIGLSNDGEHWRIRYSTEDGVAQVTHVYLPETSSRLIRLDMRGDGSQRGFGIVRVEIQPHAFSASINAFVEAIAQRSTPGLYPKYLLGRQTYWTPVGTGDDRTQALLNEEGMVEVDKGVFSVEPFLWTDDRLITWADAAPTQSLERGYLPIPSSQWHWGDLGLRTTAFATGSADSSTLFIRYRLANDSKQTRSVSLFAAVRPFQVTPTWQHWQGFGGVAPIRELAFESGALWVDGRKRIVPLTTPDGFGAASSAQGGITEFLKEGDLPPQGGVSDGFGYASGALRFDLELPPHAQREIYLAAPFGESSGGDDAQGGTQHPPASQTSAEARRGRSTVPALEAPPSDEFDRAVQGWEAQLGRFQIQLPPGAAEVIDTLKTAAAHILINRDGPALQPGPRRYSRSWIRDGAVMSAALAQVGIAQAGRDFIRWYAGFQTQDGNLPDCVDRDGCEWRPEFDSWGQMIFAVMDHYRFSADRPFLTEQWPAVLKSVDYIESLRGQRLTAKYKSPDYRAFYGLLPESMSHEGYMAHPVHAYWDDFWALRGLKDAAEMARVLDDGEQGRRISLLRDDFAKDLYASLDRVIRERSLDFVPGSVELADFDPAATAVALTVVDELHRLPRPFIDQTFDKYLEGFRRRARGEVPWTNYSAYEIRIIGALVRLGRRSEAHELLEFFLADRRILPWNQWPEISWHDPRGPSFIGDMPHSWIGAEYILAVRSLFAYERDADQSLVIAAGVSDEWLAGDGEVRVQDLPTYYGRLSYVLRREAEHAYRLTLWGDLRVPPGGILVTPPLRRPITGVQINVEHGAAAFGPDWARCAVCPADILLQC
jgi:hypothetical protein